MSRGPIQPFSIRAALAVGVAATVGIWLFTGYSFAQRLTAVQRQAAEVAARYTRDQELLSTVRAQVLLSSILVRDALLNPDTAADAQYIRQLDAIYVTIGKALSEYVSVLGSETEVAQVRLMRRELEELHRTSLAVIAEGSGQTAASVRDLLNLRIVPRREAVLSLSEKIQSLNESVFIQEQNEIAEIHRVAGEESWQRLGIALAASVGVAFFVAFYAARLENRLRQQMEREKAISSQLQDMASRLLSAQEDERRAISRELHDEVGQVLTAIKVELALVERALATTGETARPLAEAQRIADGALQAVRDLTQLLRPALLDDLGLPAAIDASLRSMARRHEIRAELHHDGMDERLNPETEVAAYRIVQEALTNVARHSGAKHCWVRLERGGSALRVEIEDDGKGFEPARQQPAHERGIGLVGIRERAVHLGGTFDLRSAPGQGTRMTIELPAGASSV